MAFTPVQKELGKIAAEYRRFRTVQSLARLWGIVSIGGLFFLVLHWFFNVYIPYSLTLLFASGAIGAFILVRRYSSNEVLIREVARLVERDDPRLNSLLLAALEQSPDPQTGDLNFLQMRVIREALEANRKSPWSQKFTERLFYAQCCHLAALVGLSVVLIWLASSAPPRVVAQRTRTLEGIQVTPGNTAVERGSVLAIVAEFPEIPGGAVQLLYKPANGPEQNLAMTQSLDDPLYGITFTDVQQSGMYRVRYGSETTGEYRIEVFDYPELKRADALLKYPEYTRFEEAKIEDTRRVTAVEGTEVNYSFFVNKPLKSAVLRGKDNSAVELASKPGEPLVLETKFVLEQSSNFSLELVDEAGRTNKLPPEFTFVALKNNEPKMKLQSPRGDQRVSALQEVRFEGTVEDDFGLSAYGLAYTLAGQKTVFVDLGTTNADAMLTKPHEARTFASLLPLEAHRAEVGQLVSYYVWADDLGPDGQKRRSAGDIFFAEVRPFEEIFRESNSPSSASQQQQQQGQGQNNPATKLLELQKEIITATWNLQRRESGKKPSSALKADAQVVAESQTEAIQQAQSMKERVTDEKSRALTDVALRSMQAAEKQLEAAVADNSTETLAEALEAEQSAYQALLKLQAREYQVQRGRQQQGGQSGGGQQRAQAQLDQLELKEEENRYETQSEAAPLQSPEQRESLQVLNRLKELARRQQDMSERLKELQTALNEAKSQEEKEKLERQLKRLQEEQRQIVQDMDELQQRMQQPENQSRMAEAREQLQDTRDQSRETAEQLQQQNVGQALSSSTKAEEQLEKLSDDFRKSTSSQFAEDMREMRQQARDLERRQEELSQKLAAGTETRRRSLSDEGPQGELRQALADQRGSLTNLLQNMRLVTEQSEAAEPLLSRQLYETLRKTSQASPEKALELASQLIDRNFIPQARQAQESAGDAIRELKEGVERAANSVLGDEAESLRFAQRELERLADRAERELNAATGRGQTNRAGGGGLNGGTNNLGRASLQQSTNTLANAGSRDGGTNQLGGATAGGTNQVASLDGGTNQFASAAGRQQNGGEQTGQEGNRTGSQSGQSQEGSSSQPGENGPGQSGGEGGEQQLASSQGQQRGEQAGGERGGEQPSQQQGAQQGRGTEGGRAQAGQNRSGQDGRSNQPGDSRNQEGQGNRSFFEQWANGGGGGGGGGGGAFNLGPLTGSDFTSWSDRLRDLEEVLQDPSLRNDVARIRDRARGFRTEFKHEGSEPQWDLVEADVIRPLRILQKRVADDLARMQSREAVVPIDRDPVPAKYSELVSRYYETLGKE